MGKILGLAPPAVSAETLTAVAFLRQEIEAGRIVGLAWVAIGPGFEYHGDVAGVARTSRALTQSALLQLVEKVGQLPPQR